MPYGANMAFTKKAVIQNGGFDTKRGRVGNFLGAGEESKLFHNILDRGGKVLLVPDIPVLHWITKERTRKSYFRKWQVDAATQQTSLAPHSSKLLPFPPWLIKVTMTYFMKSLFLYLKGNHNDAFLTELRAWEHIGHIRGNLQSAKNHGPRI